MKIKEVMSEGFWSGVGAVGKGLVQGVSQAAAPETTAAILKKSGGDKDFKMPELISSQEARLNNIAATLKQKAGTDKTVSMDDIEAAVSGTVSEATNKADEAKQAEIAYIIEKLKAMGIKVVTPEPGVDGAPDKVTWNPDTSILTYNGQQYQKKKNGWMDWYYKEMIDPKAAKEIQAAFDKATGRVAPSNPTVKPIQVKSPKTGLLVTKNEQDGIWYVPGATPSDNPVPVEDPADIAELERRARPQYQNRQMAQK